MTNFAITAPCYVEYFGEVCAVSFPRQHPTSPPTAKKILGDGIRFGFLYKQTGRVAQSV